jgi:hypothetical protein
MDLSPSSSSRCFFSNSLILKVSTALMDAMTKYIKNIRPSSGVSMWKVIVGGIKKKFHIRALNRADIITGKISKRMALRETAINSIRATAP